MKGRIISPAIPALVGASFWLSCFGIHASVLYVNVSNAAPVSPYLSWAMAATNIQDAVNAASAGDTVLVTNGVYGSGGDGTNRVRVLKVVTVQSVSGPAATIIVGDMNTNVPVRCVYLTNGAVLSGFTVTNGLAFYGSGVYCTATNAVVTNCVITGNSLNNTNVFNYFTSDGGGAYGGYLLDCILENNAAGHGGGVCSNILKRCVLAGNHGINGGGGYGCVFLSCSLSNNVGDLGGGGAYLSSLGNCIVNSNNAPLGEEGTGGGGIAYSSATNCLMLYNSGTIGGAATLSDLDNCTVIGSTRGSGAYGGSFRNCIVLSNLPSNYSFVGSIYSTCTTPLVTNGIFGMNNIASEPLFVNPAAGDYHLLASSPCIDAGTNFFAGGPVDLDGNSRIAGGTVDMGAYEFQGMSAFHLWMQQHGLPSDGSADHLDSGGDGFDNHQEWLADTNPTNKLSLLKVTAVIKGFSDWIVWWQSVTSRVYFVDRATNLGAGSPFVTLQANIPGKAIVTTYVDTNAPGGGPFFYRVGVGP